MAGLEADTGVYALSRPQGGGVMNPLDMMGKFAAIQNTVNQNALFQQEFRAKQALGPIAQASVGPDGQMDWNKFAVNVSRDPNASFLAPQILQNIASKQLLDQQTIEATLTNHQKMFSALASALTPAVQKGDNITGGDVAEAGGMALALGVPKDWILKELATMPAEDQKVSVPLPNGQVVQQSALAQWAKNHQMVAATSGDNIAKVLPQLGTTDAGGVQVSTVQNQLTGEKSVAPGAAATIVKGPSAADQSTMVDAYDPNTGRQIKIPRAQAGPMYNGVGQPLPTNGVPNTQGAASPTTAAAGGGVYSAPSPYEKDYGTERANATAEYEKNLNDLSAKAQNNIVMLNTRLSLLRKFKAGGGSTYRKELAQGIQAIMPVLPDGLKKGAESMIGSLMSGDGSKALAAAQMFEKYAAIGSMTDLITAQGSHYRPAAVEYVNVLANNARIDTDPKASAAMLLLGRRLATMPLLEQAALSKYKDTVVPRLGLQAAMEKWPSVWSKIVIKNGYLGPDVKKAYETLGGKSWNNFQGAVDGTGQ